MVLLLKEKAEEREATICYDFEIIFCLILEDKGNASPNKFRLLKLPDTSYLI